MKTKKFRDEKTASAGKVDTYLDNLAKELRAGSSEHSSHIKPFQTYKVDEVTVDGVWGTSKVTVTYDAAGGSTSTEEIKWKNVGDQWYLASSCDEGDDE
jgi:hypothetical protein